MDSLEFRIGWLGGSHGSAAEKATLAHVEVVAGGTSFTELEDRLAATTRSSARLSVLHLGRWLAANWWRLRFEPRAKGLDWRMSHDLAAAGGGYLWPTLLFFTDGATMTIAGQATRHLNQPVQYLWDAEVQISMGVFERATDQLMALLTGRLSGLGIAGTDVEALWREVQKERADERVSKLRRYEALLGLDPDDLAPDRVLSWVAQGGWMGAAALDETMAAARSTRMDDDLALLKKWSMEADLSLDIRETEALQQRWWARPTAPHELPWQRGLALAALVRDQMGLDAIEPVSKGAFHELMGADVQTGTPVKAPLGAGFRGRSAAGRVQAALQHGYPTSRRFAAARILADVLDAPAEDVVLPVTDGVTARQKVQRAFAQELLCPTAALREKVSLPEPADAELMELAELYEVSEWTVRSALVNRGLVGRGYLPDRWAGGL